MVRDRRSFLTAALAMLGVVSSSGAGFAAPVAKVYIIHLKNLKFGPTPDRVRIGDTIEWMNDDIFRHTATARNGAFDVDLQPGAKARVLLKGAGEIDFYCRYHPGMTGHFRVTR
jgi:plastocyanin